ncbi:MAG: HD domain-containing protein [Chloroflexi bacterium]|nr:HD domain-containing protein [Chloroflexota bacterium]
MKGAVHRFAQGAGALFAFARSPDLDLARRHLSPCEYHAFRLMSRSEQLHSLNVLRKALKADPAAPRSLRTAALLHDVGKSRCHLSTWQKTFAVIIEAIAPRLSRRLSEDETISFWRAPFVVRRHHAKWSGEILRNCDSGADVIWLVESHQDDPERHRNSQRYELLASLQSADGQC